MNENNVIELLKHGSLDEFLDCLDYAPEGVIELIKKFAVQLPLDNYEKRQALKTKTGFDVDAAVANSGLEPDAKQEEEIKQAVEQKPAGGRRTVATKYKVVTQG